MDEPLPLDEVPTLRIRRPDVLLAEDDLPLRSLLEEALGAAGLVVASVADGAALARELQAARWLNRSPTVVLTDLAMPGLSGFEVMSGQPDAPNRPTFMVMTAFPSADVAEIALSLGAVEVFSKPFNLKALCAHVVAQVQLGMRAKPAAATAPSTPSTPGEP